MVKSGTWVNIRSTILKAGERASNIPEDTAETPLVMWIKGYLLADCKIGEKAQVQTVTGRIESGILEEAEPSTDINFGIFVPEVMKIGVQARKELGGEAFE